MYEWLYVIWIIRLNICFSVLQKDNTLSQMIKAIWFWTKLKTKGLNELALWDVLSNIYYRIHLDYYMPTT